MNIRWKPALLLLTVFSMGAGEARSQEVVCRSVLSGAGVNGINQHYRIAATLAQAAIGLGAGQSVSVAQGFWQPSLLRTANGQQPPTTGSSNHEVDLIAAPNLFSESTQLTVSVPRAGRISLILYDLLGKPVRTLLDAEQPAGNFTLRFAAQDMSAGCYTAILTAGGEQRSVTLMLVK